MNGNDPTSDERGLRWPDVPPWMMPELDAPEYDPGLYLPPGPRDPLTMAVSPFADIRLPPRAPPLALLASGLLSGFAQARLARQQRQDVERQEQNRRFASAAAFRNRQNIALSAVDRQTRARTLSEERAGARKKAERAESVIPVPEDVRGYFRLPVGATRTAQEIADLTRTAFPERFRRELAGGSADEETVENASQMVESGQVPLTSFPVQMRSKITNAISARGGIIVPDKARAGIQKLNAARGVIGELRFLSGTLGLATTPQERLTVSPRLALEASTQASSNAALFSKAGQGFLATLSRAAGEVGTLTDQDIGRARQLVPSLWDTREVALGKINLMEKLLDEIEQRTIKTFTTSPAARRNPTAPPDSVRMERNGVIKLVPRSRVDEMKRLGATELP